MNAPLRYYAPLEVPSFCFIWEAVMWVTFGRFPEGPGYDAQEDLDGELGRCSFAWQDTFGGPGYRFRGFWWVESEMVGIDASTVDWERYEDAMRTGYWRREDTNREIANHKAASLDDDGREYYLSLLEKRLKEQPFVDDVHRLYQQHIDIGWAKIFQALVSGALTGYGWGDLTQDEIRDRAAQGLVSFDHATNEGNVYNPWHAKIPEADLIGPLLPLGALMEIPRKEWSLSGIAPDARYETAAGRRYWDVMFPGDKLFALFPRPLFSAGDAKDVVEISNAGLAISIDDGSALHPVKPVGTGVSRGRKKLANGEIERACQSLYGRRLASGEKELALAEEASLFAMEVWGEKLSRSTFQEYMRPFKRPLPETMPEIAAE